MFTSDGNEEKACKSPERERGRKMYTRRQGSVASGGIERRRFRELKVGKLSGGVRGNSIRR